MVSAFYCSSEVVRRRKRIRGFGMRLKIADNNLAAQLVLRWIFLHLHLRQTPNPDVHSPDISMLESTTNEPKYDHEGTEKDEAADQQSGQGNMLVNLMPKRFSYIAHTLPADLSLRIAYRIIELAGSPWPDYTVYPQSFDVLKILNSFQSKQAENSVDSNMWADMFLIQPPLQCDHTWPGRSARQVRALATRSGQRDCCRRSCVQQEEGGNQQSQWQQSGRTRLN